jgi:hypothetical protein
MTVKKTAGAITGACQYQKRLVGAKSRTSGWELHGNLGQSGGIPPEEIAWPIYRALERSPGITRKSRQAGKTIPWHGYGTNALDTVRQQTDNESNVT